MFNTKTFEELGRGDCGTLTVAVESAVTPYLAASRWEPSEGGVEVTEVWAKEYMSVVNGREVTIERDGRRIWDILDRVADRLVEDCVVSELV